VEAARKKNLNLEFIKPKVTKIFKMDSTYNIFNPFGEGIWYRCILKHQNIIN